MVSVPSGGDPVASTLDEQVGGVSIGKLVRVALSHRLSLLLLFL